MGNVRLSIFVALVGCTPSYLGDTRGAIDDASTDASADGSSSSSGGPSDGGPTDGGPTDAPYDSGPPNDAGPGKVIFVTSQTFTGNLGGLAGADAKCAMIATSAMLSGTFRAWLSMPGSGNSANERHTHASIPYRRTDGFTVANNYTGLVSAALFGPVNVDEQKRIVPSSELVWTNTKPDGDNGGNYCNSWIADVAAQKGKFGRVSANNGTWTYDDMAQRDCNELLHLYCVEQ